jgi:ribosomal protein S3
MSKYSPELLAICEKISQFYLYKNGGDYEKATQEIRLLGITEIELVTVVKIKTSMPGRLIGKRGENLDKMIEAVGHDIKIFEVDAITDMLIPRKPEERCFEDDDYDRPSYCPPDYLPGQP